MASLYVNTYVAVHVGTLKDCEDENNFESLQLTQRTYHLLAVWCFSQLLSGIGQVMDLGNTCPGHLILSLILLFAQCVGMVAFSD